MKTINKLTQGLKLEDGTVISTMIAIPIYKLKQSAIEDVKKKMKEQDKILSDWWEYNYNNMKIPFVFITKLPLEKVRSLSFQIEYIKEKFNINEEDLK